MFGVKYGYSSATTYENLLHSKARRSTQVGMDRQNIALQW